MLITASEVAEILGMTLQQVDGPTLNRHYALMMAGSPGYPAVGPKTVKNVVDILHRAYRDAIRWKGASRNPVEDSDPPRVEKRKEMRTWTPAELATFLDGVLKHRNVAMWWISGSTGTRRGEGLGATWTDLRWDTRELVIRRAIIPSESAPGWRWSTPKTRAGWRTVVLDRSTIAVLKAHRARQNAEKLAMGPGYNDQDLITALPNGDPVKPDNASEQFQRLVKKLGLPRIRLHDLRHTHATLALELGIHPPASSRSGSVTATCRSRSGPTATSTPRCSSTPPTASS